MLKIKKQLLIKFIVFTVIICVCGIIYVAKFYDSKLDYRDDAYDNKDMQEVELITGRQDKSEYDVTSLTADETANQNKNNNKIWVYITGAVKKSGVYCVDSDARLDEVVKMAGGFTKKADETSVNLAQNLTDGEHIHVYTVDEKNQEQIDDKQGDTYTSNISSGDSRLININTANKDELMTLPSIGESKALKIIEYRQNNRFNCIEDIMNISGIKEAAFNKIKDFICI